MCAHPQFYIAIQARISSTDDRRGARQSLLFAAGSISYLVVCFCVLCGLGTFCETLVNYLIILRYLLSTSNELLINVLFKDQGNLSKFKYMFPS